MAEGIISDLVAKSLVSLGKPAFKEVVSWWGARDDLKKLENTMTFIQARVCDAERRQEGENSELIKLWLRKLKQVLYRADDLFDHVLTLDRQNMRVERSTLAKVSILFSKSGPFFNNRKLAHEIKSIRKELDAIKSDMDGLNLSANLVAGLPLPMERLISNRQTASFVKVEDVIGRENDKNIIIGMLFDPKFDDGKRITVIPIVGFGGLGKTTLAQLIFNDEIIRKHFHLTEWVCVPEVGDQNTIMRRVYQSFTGDKDSDRLLVGQIKSGIQKSIKDKKYLLVLDDIWDESRDSWLDLLNLLGCGASGSRVIVTTRSANVAKVVGTTEAHNLGLLTTEESWNLFKQFSFNLKQEESNPILTIFAKEIVDSCGNVPLAIRVVGGLLYSVNSEKEWQRIRNARLSKTKLKEDNNIMQVLKLSYDYLSPPLKQCFAYCSLFPKDYSYYKNHLVRFWMAQGYFDPSSSEIGEQYYMELLGRNLFHNPEFSEEGNIIFCEMHDLVHDLAQDIAGEEMKLLVEPSNLITTDGVMHVSVEVEWLENAGWEAPVSLLAARKLRSLRLFSFDWINNTSIIKASSLEMMVLKFQCLRVLNLMGMKIFVVPNTVGKLRHLRYLNLAWNDRIRSIPDDVTRLENLQTRTSVVASYWISCQEVLANWPT
ncbi:putative disease resistance protein RGA1 [Chenopodium quinoa]|uniref:Disease resistance protein RGA3 n=1 Tax=Chenopodium quinoa TaxID=63459 RepID=A0A803LBX1_CHEQI|nr:putative disease resistance protein RGA1 [Chenopodium quinoa]